MEGTVLSKNSRKRKCPHKNKDIENALNKGFIRCLVKSSVDEKLIGVYYITPDLQHLCNQSQLNDWLKNTTLDHDVSRSDFSFVPRKMTKHDNEMEMDIRNLSEDILTFYKDQISKAPNDSINYESEPSSKRQMMKITVNDDSETKNCVIDVMTPDESNSKQIKEIEANSDSYEEDDSTSLYEEPTNYSCKKGNINNYMTTKVNIQPLRQNRYYKPIQYESVPSCYEQRLGILRNVDVSNVIKTLKPVCGEHCSYELNGFRRAAFECTFCLALWHDKCSGYRNVVLGCNSAMMCDNCYSLYSVLSVNIGTIYSDSELLFQIEYKPELRSINSIDPILKLCKIQWTQNYITELTKMSQNNDDLPLTEMNNFKVFYRIKVTNDMKLREENFDILRIKYKANEVETLAKIFADPECKLLVNKDSIRVVQNKVIVHNAELVVPLSRKIPNCLCVFYIVERQQELNMLYMDKFKTLLESLKKSFTGFNNIQSTQDRCGMPTRYHSIQNCTSAINEGSNQSFNNVNYNISLINSKSANNSTYRTTSNIREIVSNDINNSGNINIATNRPSNSNRPNVLTTESPIVPSTTSSTIPTLRLSNHNDFDSNDSSERSLRTEPVKMEVCKQTKIDYLRSRAFNILNLPFSVLVTILSHPDLTISDRFNCRFVNKVFCSAIDASELWSKLTLYNHQITGSVCSLVKFITRLRTKKITLYFDMDKQRQQELINFLGYIFNLTNGQIYVTKFSLKLNGAETAQHHRVFPCLQKILKTFTRLCNLSIKSENPVMIDIDAKQAVEGKFLEKLKLVNIFNESDLNLSTTYKCTPKLRRVVSDAQKVIVPEPAHLNLSFIFLTELDIHSASLEYEDLQLCINELKCIQKNKKIDSIM